MRVLYITSKPIFPIVDGGCVAMERFLRSLLNSEIEVKHLLIETKKHQFNINAYPDELYKQTNPERVKINTNVKPIGALKYLFKSGSYNIDRFDDPRMLKLILETLSGLTFDAIIFDSLFTTAYLKDIRNHFSGKMYIRTHNVECELWKGYAKDAGGIKRWYLNKLAIDIEKYELDILDQVDGVFSISSIDTRLFQKMGIQSTIHDISVAVEAPTIEHDYSNNELYHLGSMDWIPNQEAVERLIKLCPRLREKLPNVSIHIAGLNAENYHSSDKSNGIIVHGFVQHINVFASEHGILVTPIQSGSGIRIKILEAMAIGIPVLTTTTGAQGIDHTESDCLIIADSDAEIIKAMISLINDQALREKIGSNAIDYIRKNHTIEDISQKLLEILSGK